MRAGQWVMLIAAVCGFAIWPLVFRASVLLSVLLALLLGFYIIWSVVVYLRWARTLGRDKAGDENVG